MCNKTTIECKPSLVQVKPPSHKSEPHDPNVAREITTPNSESQASAGMNPATGGPTMPPAGGMMMPGFFPPAGRYGYHPYYLPPGSMPYHAPLYQTGVPNQNLLQPIHAYPPSVDIPMHPAGYHSALPFSNTLGGSNNTTHSRPHIPLLSADKLSIPTLKAWLRHLDN